MLNPRTVTGLLLLLLLATGALAGEGGAISLPAMDLGDHPLASQSAIAKLVPSGTRLAVRDALLRWGENEPKPQGSFGLEEKPAGARSLRNALLLSVAVPGLGQRYLGAPKRGWLFTGAELGTWGTWGTFKIQERLRKSSYEEMAEVFAGVEGEHEDDYWKVVGQFPDWLEYNEWLRYLARREYGFGTSEYYQYIADNEIAAAQAWNWNNEDRRRDYAEKRKASLNAERRATYTLYALLVNRVIATVDTWRLYRTRANIRTRIEEQQSGLGLDARPGERGVRWRLGWYRSF